MVVVKINKLLGELVAYLPTRLGRFHNQLLLYYVLWIPWVTSLCVSGLISSVFVFSCKLYVHETHTRSMECLHAKDLSCRICVLAGSHCAL